MVILTTCIYLRNFFLEHSDIPEGYRGTVLLLKPDQCKPGYTRLEIYRDTPDNPLEIYSNQDGKLYLDRIRFLKITLGSGEIEQLEIHGPAFVAFNHIGKRNGDVVMCFDCPM